MLRDIPDFSSKMSIAINFTKTAVVLVKHFAPIVSSEALKLGDGYFQESGINEGTYHIILDRKNDI